MRLLLDTHALLWWWQGNARLSATARDAIADAGNEILVSAVAAWEIATKVRIGKMPEADRLSSHFRATLDEQGFRELSITIAHAQRAGTLRGAHKDPFDRMMAAQALIEGVPVITNDPKLESFGVHTIW